MNSPLGVAVVREQCESPSWAGSDSPAEVSVIVSTFCRSALLLGLLDALAAQSFANFEVVVADNGSIDDTWAVLETRCAATSLRLQALRLDPQPGPGVPRNTAVSLARGRWLAFTDDDCLPTPSWLNGLSNSAAAGGESVTVIQGRTLPEPGGWGGPWGRTVRVERLSGLFETANLACPRSAFLATGGFASEITAGNTLLASRAFGEDVLLGSRLARSGHAIFAVDALVHHRVMPGSYPQFLAERARLSGFPALVGDVPQLRATFFAGVFLTRRTALADLGLASLLAATVTRKPLLTLGALPWALECWRGARDRPGRPQLMRAAQVAVGDVVGAAALLAGSLKSRRPVL